jgi:caa(3)-type oxidase subunit IV
MSAHSAEEIHKHVKVYITVFVALAGLTVITVGLFYLKLPIHLAVLFALVVAAIKASLVAGYFMHLISERKVIYWVLGICVFFFLFLMLLPTLTVRGW